MKVELQRWTASPFLPSCLPTFLIPSTSSFHDSPISVLYLPPNPATTFSMKTSALILAAFCLTSFAGAESVKDREGAVRNDKATMEKNGRWIYNDIDAAFAKAKETGKPLMVVLRCVPCVSCMELDADVVELKGGLEPLADEFICARIINANTLDLSLFQFDYDVS
ncbi:MAG: hypothetical protein RL693_1227, partial [Verrucomicrobiota bacterium]